MRHPTVLGHSCQCWQSSSATILFILEWLSAETGEYALLAAFGPGFSAEFLLLQWT
jgi:predicted naringenin-chalcone synthase